MYYVRKNQIGFYFHMIFQQRFRQRRTTTIAIIITTTKRKHYNCISLQLAIILCYVSTFIISIEHIFGDSSNKMFNNAAERQFSFSFYMCNCTKSTLKFYTNKENSLTGNMKRFTRPILNCSIDNQKCQFGFIENMFEISKPRANAILLFVALKISNSVMYKVFLFTEMLVNVANKTLQFQVSTSMKQASKCLTRLCIKIHLDNIYKVFSVSSH